MPHPTDTFKSITCGKLRDLDPARAYDLPNRYPLANIYESLLTYSSADVRKLDPVLARAVPRIDNGLIDETGTLYRFPLRSGVLFHDKSTVTPADVRYSLLRLLFEDAPGSPSPILLRAILGIEHSRDAAGRLCIDPAEILRRVWIEDDVLLVRLARPFAPFVRSIASWLAVMPEHWAVANGEAPASEPRVGPRERESFLRTHTNGTGPFQLTRIDFSAQNLEMERFDEYWQGPAKLSKVMVHCSDDYPVVRDLLLAGEVDSIAADHRHQPELRTKPGLKLYERLPQLGPIGSCQGVDGGAAKSSPLRQTPQTIASPFFMQCPTAFIFDFPCARLRA